MNCSTLTIDVTAGQGRPVLLRVVNDATGAPYGAPDWAFRLEVLSPWSIGTPLLTVPFSAITLPDGPALQAELPGAFSGGKSGGRYPARIIRRYNPTGWEHTDVDSDRLAVTIGSSSPAGDITPDGIIDVRVTDSQVVQVRTSTAVLPMYDPVEESDPNLTSGLSGSAIQLGRLLAHSSTGLVHYDPTNSQHAGRLAGISVSSASAAGQTVAYRRGGIVPIDTLTLVPNEPYRAGANGQLSSTTPGGGFTQVVGVALSSNQFFFNPQIIIQHG